MIKYLTYASLLIFVFFAFFGIVNAKPLFNEKNYYNVREIFDDEEQVDKEVSPTCEGVLGDKNDENSVAFLLQEIFDILKIASPVLVLIFSLFDFMGAVASQDKDRLIKAVKNTFIRGIVGLIVFVVPVLCDFFFELTGMYSTCGIQ